MFLFVSVLFNAAATAHKKQVLEKKSAIHTPVWVKKRPLSSCSYVVPSFKFGRRQAKMFILTMGE